jgi:osmotically-inducible protein OsmY
MTHPKRKVGTSFVDDAPASSTEDATIREHLLAVLETQPWTPAIDVAVRNGVVQLSGKSLTRGNAKRYELPLKTFQR